MLQRKSFNFNPARTAGMLSGARRVTMLLVTLLLTMTAQTAWADTWPEYIKDIILVGGTASEANAAKNAHSGYTWCSTSLNDGTSGDVIYIGYKKDSRANVHGGYITDFIVVNVGDIYPPATVLHNSHTYSLCPYDGGSHFKEVKGYLNSNNNGRHFYLYYTKDNIGKQVATSIDITLGQGTSSGAVDCYEQDGNYNNELKEYASDVDLNDEAGGSYVYMHFTTTTKTNRPSVDPVMATGLTYDGSAKQLIATGATLANGTMYYRIGTSGSWISNVADVKATNAGTHTVYYYASSTDYSNQSEISSSHSKSVTIAKAPNSGVTVSCADIVEGSNAPDPQLGGTNLSTGAVTYKYCTTPEGDYTTTEPTAIGTYYVKATIAADVNCYEFTTAAASFKIVRDVALHSTGDSEDDPYIISTTDDLDLLAQRVNAGNTYYGKFFKLGADITYSHTTEWDDVTSSENNYTPIGNGGHAFKGTFDGQGHTVSGIRYNASHNFIGLFGNIEGGATVKNVILSDARIIGKSSDGGIAGRCHQSTITNCWVKSNVCIGNMDQIGGIAGSSYKSTISGCRSEATLIVSGSDYKYYGGIVGDAVNNNAVSHCVVVGATIPDVNYRGAVVGGKVSSTLLTSNYYTACTVAGVANATNVGCNGADADGARQAVAIGAATGVTVTPTGTATTYDVSGITAYEDNNGILYGGQLYAGATETVTLTLTGGKYYYYDADLVVLEDQSNTNYNTIIPTKPGKLAVFTRSFATDIASTICLPFPMTDIEGGNVYEFVGVEYNETNGWVATMSDATPDGNKVTSTEANKPYLFMPTSTGNVIFSGTIPSDAASYDAGTTTSADGDWTFHGTYSRLVFGTNLDGAVYGFASTAAEADENQDAVDAGEFVRADDGAGVPPFRCYLTYSGSNSALQARGVTRGESEEVPETITVRLIGKNGETEGIGTLTLSTGEFSTDGWYSLDGRKLDGKPTKKGLYIHDGLKVVIK